MFENNTLVNFIIPVYNRGELVTRTLDSIYNSKLKNIRVICVDDGSQDNSVKVIKEYQTKRKDLILVENTHGGVSAARNRGLDFCEDGYVTFLDSDDCLCDEISDLDIEQATSYNVDVISFDFFVNNEIKGIFEKRCKNKCLISGGTDNVRYGEKHFSSFLFKYALLKKYNIRFYEGIQYNEDEVFRTYALYHSVKTIYLDKVWFTYNKHCDSLSHSKEKKKGTNHVLKVWNYAIDYFKVLCPQDELIMKYCEEKIEWVKEKIANGGDN